MISVMPSLGEGDFSFAGFDVRNATPDRLIVCTLKANSLRETFTTEISAFAIPKISQAVKRPGLWAGLLPVGMDLTITSSPGRFEVVDRSAGTGRYSEGKVHLEPGQGVAVRFTSFWEEQRRDWYLVLIGAMVALGAALLVEVARPFIDQITESGRP
jgi:hypothetical protein